MRILFPESPKPCILRLMASRINILAIVTTMISLISADAASQASGDTVPVPIQPVILVHGFADNSGKMRALAAYLRARGWTVYTPTVSPSWGQVGLDVLARQLAAYIDATLPRGEKFDLVGFSMGALVSRYYLQRMDGARRVTRFVTLGAPHHGSMLAWFIQNDGCRQMRPGSNFLNDLNSDPAAFQTVRLTSIWTPFDLSIIPSVSSEMPQARNCRINVILHPLLVFDRRCLSTVAAALRE